MKLEELKKIAEARTKDHWGLDWCQDHYNDSNPRYWRAEGPLVTSRKQAISDSEFIVTSANHFDAFLKLMEAAHVKLARGGDDYCHKHGMGYEKCTCGHDELKKAIEEVEGIE